MGLFGKQLEGEAVILEDEGAGMMEQRQNDVMWEWHKYVIEVRPAGEAPFRTETKARVATFYLPRKGDTVKVLYDPKKHSAEMQINGDPRYDPRIKWDQAKELKRAEQQRVNALLAGEDLAPAPARTSQDDPLLADLEAVERLEAEARNREG
jgi:hypothetical protein